MDNHNYNNTQFVVDDLLEFPNDDVMVSEGMLEASAGVHSGDSSNDVNTIVDSCNSSFSGDAARRGFADPHFSSNLCVPYDDMAELEWLSNFEEESFSSEDLQNLQIISGIKPRVSGESSHQTRGDEAQNNPTLFNSEVSVPGKARSKRSRITPGNWTSRLLALTQAAVKPPSSRESDFRPTTGKKTMTAKKKDSRENASNSSGSDGRRCLHCATDKTPQWRTGPMGPKTLCNACGVRYKSGRLVPEYRPAASPTFMLTKHSNSHRKVMELRRQKEVQRAHQQQQQFMNHHSMMYDVPNGDEYLIHHHVGPDFQQLI